MIGVIGTVASLMAALAATAFALGPALWLYLRAFRLGREVGSEEDGADVGVEGP